MSGQRATPASITMISIIIATALGFVGFLVVNKITTNELTNCDELAALFYDPDPGTNGNAQNEVDSVRVAC